MVWNSTSSGGCNNIPEDKWQNVKSIRTDTCFIAYRYRFCDASETENYLPGDIMLPSDRFGSYSLIRSFETCNEEEGSNQLNFDITKHTFNFRSSDVLEKYKKVCSCINVPQYVHDYPEWSINNHHNDLLAYFEPNCLVNKLNPKLIAAGGNYDSSNMHRHRRIYPVTNTTYIVKSFGPNPNSTYFQNSCNSTHVTNQSTNLFETTTKSGLDVTQDQNIFQSEALMNSLKKVWSHNKKGKSSLPKSDWTCMSCFDDEYAIVKV